MAEISLSTFPSAIDTFKRYSDLDAATLKKAETYKGYIEAGDYTTAEQYLNDEDNEDLASCGIGADIINKHSDAIVALEEESKVHDVDIGVIKSAISSHESTLNAYGQGLSSHQTAISLMGTEIDNIKGRSSLRYDYMSNTTSETGNPSGTLTLKSNNNKIATMNIYNLNSGIKLYSYNNGGQLNIDLNPDEIAKQTNKYYGTEKVIGTYMGKILYQYVFTNSFATNDLVSMNITSLGIKDVVEMTGVASSKVAGIKQYYTLGSDKFNVYIHDIGTTCTLNITNKMEYIANDNSTWINVKIIIKYTKD